MKKALIVLLIFLMLTACGGNASPAPVANPSATIAAPTVNAPPTNTLPAVIPTNAANCENSASFESDVTVPDNTPFAAGESFTKIWRVRNNGTCGWIQGYTLSFANGEEMGAPAVIQLPYTPPGETADISVDLVAPDRNGAFVGNFEFRDPADRPFAIDYGKYIWVSIIVGDVVAIATHAGGATSTPTPTVLAPCAYIPNPDFVNQTLALINSQRAARDLSALTVNAQLSAAAQAHAADMACNDFLSHIGSDGSSAKERVVAAGYSFSIALETIFGQPPQFGGNPESAVQWWMSDLIHRSAILHEKVTEIGIGYAFVAESSLQGYWSVMFAAP
ncbi:MAG: hypothetical protein HY867_09875 [Chloroflexi bacterium]|nr:hypothetical protein [Chloroflexota bacterium]